MLNLSPRGLLTLSLLCLSACAHKDHTQAINDDVPTAVVAPEASREDISLPNSPLDPDKQRDSLAALPDLWQRLIQQSSIEVPDRADIRREMQFYGSKQKFFNEVASRAEPYLYLIVTELEKRRMPIEIALLPIVESAFNPAAVGNGPAGLWQMVPQTARNFGLQIQPGYDGRKDPVTSTYAVLDYLQHLYDTLDQDWLNAVAAYNTGEGRIKLAIERNKAKGLPTDYWNLHIPSRFVQTMPKWLAMINLVREPATHQLQLPFIANKAVITVTTVKGAASLAQTAQLAGIAESELRRLNPAFKLAMTPQGKEFPLVLPLHALDSFVQQRDQLRKVAVVLPATTSSKAKTREVSYTVKNGDTLGDIARKYNTRVATLKTLNNLKSDQLKPGQKLRLPAEKSAKADTKVAKTTGSSTTHTVKSGESLDRIARQYKIKLADLLKWNGLTADSLIKPGQQLRLIPRQRNS